MLLYSKPMFSKIVSNHRLHLKFYGKINNKKKKSLSIVPLNFKKQLSDIPEKINGAKALKYVRQSCVGSFTVEAAMTVPVFLFAVLLALGIFWLLDTELRVSGGIQYAARSLAASASNQENQSGEDILSLAESRIRFRKYIREQPNGKKILKERIESLSFMSSDFSGEYITLRVRYKARLPITAFGWGKLPVQQCVMVRKWLGDSQDQKAEEQEWCFITPSGKAYHNSSSCPYLDLSIRSVFYTQVKNLRNKSGGIYYPCGCYQKGQNNVYITDYGTEYHGSLTCHGLKRTVSKVPKSQVGGRHPCGKCCGT